jgi:hypothetical protein
LTSHFELGQIAGYGFGLCMFIFFNLFAFYKSLKKCHRVWAVLIVVNIIAGILIVPLIYTIIIPVVYLIKSNSTFIKKSKNINIKNILKRLNPLKFI